MNSIFITGGNRGIGLELVRQYLKSADGYPKHVFATCRSKTDAKELSDLHSQFKDRLHVLEFDVTDYNKVSDVVKYVEGVVGTDGLNVLLNNAGIMVGARVPFGSVTPETMRSSFEVNSIAPLMLAQAFHPLLKMAAAKNSSQPMSVRRAAILNMTSRMGSIDDNTSGKFYTYRASKVAINMITVSESIDLKGEGILCATIHPGWVKTDMGSANAPTSVDECAESLIKLFHGLGEGDTGSFCHANGSKLPW